MTIHQELRELILYGQYEGQIEKPGDTVLVKMPFYKKGYGLIICNQNYTVDENLYRELQDA